MDLVERVDSLVGKDSAILVHGIGCQEFIDYLYDDQNDVPTDMVEFGTELFNRYARIIYRITNYIKPKTIVEIGTREGRSTDAFTRVVATTDGHVYSFDPVRQKTFVSDAGKAHWTFHEMKGEEGYQEHADGIGLIDLLYIDCDPHSLENTRIWLNNYWIKQLRRGGYLLMDDACPQHDTVVADKNYDGVWRILKDYGVLSGLLEFLAGNNNIEYAFTVFNNHRNGFAVVKIKE